MEYLITGYIGQEQQTHGMQKNNFGIALIDVLNENTVRSHQNTCIYTSLFCLNSIDWKWNNSNCNLLNYKLV